MPEEAKARFALAQEPLMAVSPTVLSMQKAVQQLQPEIVRIVAVGLLFFSQHPHLEQAYCKAEIRAAQDVSMACSPLEYLAVVL
jgi:hypothetical protein